MKISDYTVISDATVMEAMQQIDKNAKGIVYVVQDGILLGAITDGDIRRFLLVKGDLIGNVMEIANLNVHFLRENEECEAENVMHKFKIRSIPILNERNEIVKICFSDEVVYKEKAHIDIPVIIMAGGKGTRLYPYTQILPKPLIPIGDKTITEHIMERFQEYGCCHFDMIVNYKKNFIKSYFIDNEEMVDVEFTDEEEYLGTGGGLKLLQGKYESSFFMTNCDILIDDDYSKILDYHKKNGNIVTMVCAKKKMTIPYGIVEMSAQGNAIGLKEKPELSFITNTGFYILEPEFIDKIPANTFVHITDIIQKCIDDKEKVGVYTISDEQWLDMGQMEELEKMKQKLNVKGNA